MAAKVNEVLANRYKILSCIGEGAMGVVYKAEHVLMKKIVAIKILHAHVSQQKEIVARFQREAQAASTIDHPNICAVTEFDYTAEGDFFLVMEYLEGETLHDRLDRLGSLAPIDAISITVQTLSALQKAHEMGIVHRDIKPENIFLTTRNDDDSFVKILDFGIARNSTFDGDQRLTQTGMIYGTPQYLSPEQATGSEVSLSSDLYSIGIILYEILSGEPPFKGDNLIVLLHKHISEKPPLLKSSSPQIAEVASFDAIIQRLLKKKPEERFSSAGEVIGELSELANKLGFTLSANLQMAKLLSDGQGDLPQESLSTGAGLKSLPAFSTVTDVVTKINRSKHRHIILAIVAVLIFIAIAFFVGKYLNRKSAPVIEDKTAAVTFPKSAEPGLANAAKMETFSFETGFTISHDASLSKSRNMIAACESLFLGRWAEARDYLISEYEVFNKNPNYLKMLSYALFQSGDVDQAYEQLENLFKLTASAAKDSLISEIILSALADESKMEKAEEFIRKYPNEWMAEALALGIISGDVNKNQKFKTQLKTLIDELGAGDKLPEWIQVAVELRFNDTNACKKREDLIVRLLEINEPRAWVAIEPFSRVGKRGCTTKIGTPRDCQDCIRSLIEVARTQFAENSGINKLTKSGSSSEDGDSSE